MAIFKSATILAGLNAKTTKGDKGEEFATAIMYLAPARMAGGTNLCAMASIAACDPNDGGGCLVNAGQAKVFSSINRARIAKTKRYLADRAAFMAELARDVTRFVAWCDKRSVKPAVRLNGTSDIQWEVAHPVFVDGVRFASIFEAFLTVQFYDYTKIYKRAYRAIPKNYRLVLSYSAANSDYAAAVTKAAHDTDTNLAIVYRTKAQRDALAQSPVGDDCRPLVRPVIDGDSDDLRFLYPAGVIVGLYAKGGAKRDSSGFVVG
jgi:hypothetical protein